MSLPEPPRPAWITCSECRRRWSVPVVESPNPDRDPSLTDAVLAGTFLRFECGGCGNRQPYEGRVLWTDLPGRLCVAVMPPMERYRWKIAEEVARGLSTPLREEGPPAVRALGREVRIRVVFSLDELREKVLCRVHGRDDRLVEVVKLEQLGAEAPLAFLDAVDPGGLAFAVGRERRRVPESAYQAVTARSDLASRYPELVEGPWVNAARYSAVSGV